jgi:hypothetical protein
MLPPTGVSIRPVSPLNAGGRALTARRRRMSACLQRSGVSARPPDMDVRAVRQRAAHARTSPDVLRAEARRPSCCSVTHVTPSSRRARPIALGGLTGRDDGCRSPGTRPGRTRRHARRGARTVAATTTGTAHAGTAPTPPRAARRCTTCGRRVLRVDTRRPTRRRPP